MLIERPTSRTGNPTLFTHVNIRGFLCRGDMVGDPGSELVGPPLGIPECASRFKPCYHRDPPQPPVVCGGIVLGRKECTIPIGLYS